MPKLLITVLRHRVYSIQAGATTTTTTAREREKTTSSVSTLLCFILYAILIRNGQFSNFLLNKGKGGPDPRRSADGVLVSLS